MLWSAKFRIIKTTVCLFASIIERIMIYLKYKNISWMTLSKKRRIVLSSKLYDN